MVYISICQYNYVWLPRPSTAYSFYHNQHSVKYWLWRTFVFLFLLKSKLNAIFHQINAIWDSIVRLFYSNVAWAAANRARFGEQLTYDNPILLPNFINFESPPCSPDIPIFSSFLVAWPRSLVNFIISPTPSSSFLANGLFFIISCSRYCGKKLLASSRLIPSVVCARSFVPKLKNSAYSAKSPALRHEWGFSIIVPTL